MGFPEEWCLIALQENDNDVASASTWIVDNLDTLTSMNTAPMDVMPVGSHTTNEQIKPALVPNDTGDAASRGKKEGGRLTLILNRIRTKLLLYVANMTDTVTLLAPKGT